MGYYPSVVVKMKSSVIEYQVLDSFINMRMNRHKIYDISAEEFQDSIAKEAFYVLKGVYELNPEFDSSEFFSCATDKLGDKFPEFVKRFSATDRVPRIDPHIERLRELSRRRKIKGIGELLTKTNNSNISIQEGIESLYAIGKTTKTAASNTAEIADSIEDIFAMGNYMSTGYADLDAVTAGMGDEEFIILGARPAKGKSAVALNLAWNIAKEGKRVLFFSLEMGKRQIFNRLIGIEKDVEIIRFRTGSWSESQRKLALESAESVKQVSSLLVETDAHGISDILGVIDRENAREKIDFVVIDYLQLIRGNEKRQRNEEISAISRKLKLKTQQGLGFPILALAQLKRPANGDENSVPVMSDLKESGALEQDANQIWLLHSDDEELGHNKLQVLIAKSRSGPSQDSAILDFKKQYQRITSVDETVKNRYNA